MPRIHVAGTASAKMILSIQPAPKHIKGQYGITLTPVKGKKGQSLIEGLVEGERYMLWIEGVEEGEREVAVIDGKTK